MKPQVLAGVVLLAATATFGYSSAQQPYEEISFQKDVNPILQQNCAVCHNPGGVGFSKSGFSVQSYRTVMKGTRYGAVVIPGSSTSSNLVWLLKHGANSSVNMPKMYQMKVLSNNQYVITPSQAR